MAKANKTKYALLGVLNLDSGSGYDIKKFCDQSIGHFWNENYGHIYPVLKKLEEDNLIQHHTEESEGHQKKNIYSITEKGKDDLKNWLSLPIDKAPVRSELLLKIFFSSDIPTEYIIKRIVDCRLECINRLEQLSEIENVLNNHNDNPDISKKDIALWQITVKYGIKDAKAEIEWCDEAIKMLKSIDS